MAELLFVATIIFVAYVVFVVMGENKHAAQAVKSEKAKAVEPAEQQVEKAVPAPTLAAVKAEAKSVSVSAAEKSAVKPSRAKAPAKSATTKTARTKKAEPAPVAKSTVDSLKNPKTGEVAKVPNSYAFAKRWIKDALVEEGLLDKVYKNNELDDAVMARIQNALQQLMAMDKYQ